MHSAARMLLKIEGTVQGVGFRPFIYRLALRHRLGGTVWNDGKGVYIDAEGREEELKHFLSDISNELPVLAKITGMESNILEPKGYHDFIIAQSRGVAEGKVIVPPDAAICRDCFQEIMNQSDRHYHYAFTNCTNCGPRFTIVKELPYDRGKTSMDVFPMCPDCSTEYHNPLDRRFHAQPTACPSCGPQLILVDRRGEVVSGDWLEGSQKILSAGSILTLKGLGGFHLACDASNKEAVIKLRKRKKRPHKPLAVMCRDLKTIAEYCHVNEEEAKILRSPTSPIVILKKKAGANLPEELAPGQSSLGVMLPYTPLHVLLLHEGPPVLVMTSGNYSNMPLCIANDEAMEKLGDVADFFLLHNREIVNRCDDSVTTVINGQTQIFRRSRGYVPAPLEVPVDDKTSINVLGAGGDQKNTFCLLKGKQAFISQHIGDLDTVEGEENYLHSLKNFKALINAEPGVIAFDGHPHYRSAQLVCEGDDAAKFPVQHHHAHMASCMADNFLHEKVIGAILDGTGYGLDGCSWGFEILTGDYENFERKLHMDYIPLPGGDKAVRNPWRTAVSYLFKYCGLDAEILAESIFPGKESEINVIKRMLNTGFNAPLSSSCGRFFDAVSALLGICLSASYEGQAAIELGDLVPWPEDMGIDQWEKGFSPYPFEIKNKVINPQETVLAIINDMKKGLPRHDIAKRFHDTVVHMIVQSVSVVSERSGIKKVVFSGGSWQNRYLLVLARHFLERRGCRVFSHRRVPTNDGGLSLGQTMVAYHALTVRKTPRANGR
ncbi:MAG: carbamoyltransferase HypF [Dehalobacterium sp.]